jgi:hypothetical protein
LVKKDKPQDMKSLITYCCFIGPDIFENMNIVHGDYRDDIVKLMEMKSPLGDYNILVLLAGDFNHVCAFLGHQGSGSSYPSPYSYVTLNHLRNDHQDGSAHNLKKCKFDERLGKDLMSDYMENSANTTDQSRKTGKDSKSIIGKPLFPIVHGVVSQVVVPFLHVFTGVFCIMEKKFFADLLEHDKYTEEEVIEQEQIRKNIEVLTTLVEQYEQDKKTLAGDWTDLKNLIHLLEENIDYPDKFCEAAKCIVKNKKDYPIDKWIVCEHPDHVSTNKKKENCIHHTCEGT